MLVFRVSGRVLTFSVLYNFMHAFIFFYNLSILEKEIAPTTQIKNLQTNQKDTIHIDKLNLNHNTIQIGITQGDGKNYPKNCHIIT